LRMADMDSREGRWDSQEFQESEGPVFTADMRFVNCG
jgi:hypothetical protein